jgi:hypothetical protein
MLTVVSSGYSRRSTRLLARLVMVTMVAGCDHLTEPDDAPAGVTSLGISPAADTVAADGASPLAVTLNLGGEIPSTRTVAVTTSAGVFAENGKKAISIAFGQTTEQRVHLIPPRDEGAATLLAGVGTVSRSRLVTLRRALPDSLVLEPKDVFTVNTANAASITLVARLRRSRGMPSPGGSVTFSDTRPPGSGSAFSASPLSDAAGNVEIRYTPGLADSTARGPRTISACTDGEPVTPGVRRTVCASTTIFVL